ncbi:MAG TPA: hypothetical protein VD902_19375 [Symbiobacteriaceae bacterium]|nr:hypothetical protein [Symbiobacteriaceae bacterium]
MQHPGCSMPEFQRFHQWLDQEKGFRSDLNTNAGHDLQAVYTDKMLQNIKRTWER